MLPPSPCGLAFLSQESNWCSLIFYWQPFERTAHCDFVEDRCVKGVLTTFKLTNEEASGMKQRHSMVEVWKETRGFATGFGDIVKNWKQAKVETAQALIHTAAVMLISGQSSILPSRSCKCGYIEREWWGELYWTISSAGRSNNNIGGVGCSDKLLG